MTEDKNDEFSNTFAPTIFIYLFFNQPWTAWYQNDYLKKALGLPPGANVTETLKVKKVHKKIEFQVF